MKSADFTQDNFGRRLPALNLKLGTKNLYPYLTERDSSSKLVSNICTLYKRTVTQTRTLPPHSLSVPPIISKITACAPLRPSVRFENVCHCFASFEFSPHFHYPLILSIYRIMACLTLPSTSASVFDLSTKDRILTRRAQLRLAGTWLKTSKMA